jgi:hypothetical protein
LEFLKPKTMIIKRYFLFAMTTILSFTASAQQKGWQWIKQGGAQIEGNEKERVYDIATDSDRNIYVVSPIGVYDLKIDGNTKTFYGSSGTSVGDYALASFACDGTYRWSKIIGGRGYEDAPYIETDNNDNLYIAGSFGSCTSAQNNPPAPPRIENDIVLPPQSPTSCSLLYIAKFDKNGNLLWFKRPMPQTNSADAYTLSGSASLEVDQSGNAYWLLAIPPGTYANGTFTSTQPGKSWHIFQYDSSGNFIDATYIDIQLSTGTAATSLKMYRNPHNGYFYFTGRRDINGSATIGGQTVTGSMYLASFDGQGNFQWMRQNTRDNGSGIFSLEFDSQNNIYMGGKFIGAIGGPSDVFLGQSVPEQIFPGYVMKANPTATNVFYFSYNNFVGANNLGDFSMQNNRLAYANWGAGQNFVWGNQSININNIQGGEAVVAFFDKSTGNCTGLDFIPGNDGYSDIGTALAFDINGDVLVGGEFEHTLYDANGGSVLNPNPGNPNFFIAKYATEPCPPLAVEEMEKEGVKVWPNPVRDELYVSIGGETAFKLYGLDGRLVKKGILSQSENSIGMKGLLPGVYLLELGDENGVAKSLKVVKE